MSASRCCPTFLSVVFDPTLKKVGNVELMGHYLYDDQGVKAQRVTVVDKGVLKTFLLDRAPLKSFPRSNGHGRAEPGFLPVSRQSNLQVESSKAVSREQLMDQLRDEARRQGKPFGLLFDNIEGGFTTTGRGSPNAFNVLPNVVYRIYTDGRAPELVRGVDLIGTPLAAFGKIIATDDQIDVFNGVCGAESGGVPGVGVVAVAARQRSRSAEEGAVAGNAARFCRRRRRPGGNRDGCVHGRWSWVDAAMVASLVVASLCVDGPRAQESPTLSAMQDEMKRSMAELRMKGEAAPYYIAYEVLDRTMRTCRGGSARSSRTRRAARGRCASRCASATTRSTARVSSCRASAAAPACRARPSSRRSTTTTTRCGARSG